MSAISSHTNSIKLTELPNVIAGCEDPIARCTERGDDSSGCYVNNVAFGIRRA
jgi:hypothetical protein